MSIMKTKALKLADEVLAKEYAPRLEIAKELRRLHLENEQLKAREWVGLTHLELLKIWTGTSAESGNLFAFYQAIEAKLKEKNT
jgi:hypothetical protein